MNDARIATLPPDDPEHKQLTGKQAYKLVNNTAVGSPRTMARPAQLLAVFFFGSRIF